MVPDVPGISLSVGISVNCPAFTEITLCGLRPAFLKVIFVPGLTLTYCGRYELSRATTVTLALPVASAIDAAGTVGSGVVESLGESVPQLGARSTSAPAAQRTSCRKGRGDWRISISRGYRSPCYLCVQSRTTTGPSEPSGPRSCTTASRICGAGPSATTGASDAPAAGAVPA